MKIIKYKNIISFSDIYSEYYFIDDVPAAFEELSDENNPNVWGLFRITAAQAAFETRNVR